MRQKHSVKSVCSVREKTLQRERKNLYKVCKQPNRGNLTYHAPPCGGGVGGGATVLWVRNSTQKVSVRSVSSVREKTLQREIKIPTHYVSSPIGVTSHTTPLAIRRRVGGEARPIGVTSHTTPLAIRRGVGSKAERVWR